MNNKKIIVVIFILIFIFSCNQHTTHNQKEESITSQILQTENPSDLIQHNDSIQKTNSEVVIELIPTSVKTQTDSLHFTYKLTNKGSRSLVFYHMQYLAVAIEPDSESEDLKRLYPRCIIKITDENNKFPNMVSIMGGPKSPPKELLKKFRKNSYVVLAANESEIFSRAWYIGNLVLEAGDYKLQLQYSSVSNSYYEKQFIKLKEKEGKLKDGKLYEGTIESNICSFTY